MTAPYTILTGDCIEGMRTLPDGSVHCGVTSPPYWGLRDYGAEGQLGLEATPDLYVAGMVAVFREFRRVLRDDGTLWLNIGDSYNGSGAGGGGNRKGNEHGQHDAMASIGRPSAAGLKPKDLVGIPWRLAFALQADGWYLRSDIIWAKPNPMPESVTDRPTKAHEYMFLLSKQDRYYYDAEAVKEPAEYGFSVSTGDDWRQGVGDATRNADRGRRTVTPGNGGTRNRRTVWTIPTQPYAEAHFATFPEKLVEPCILAGCPEGGTVLDPFSGSGTTGAVAVKHGRKYIGCELNPEYVALAHRRIGVAMKPGTFRDESKVGDSPLFAGATS